MVIIATGGVGTKAIRKKWTYVEGLDAATTNLKKRPGTLQPKRDLTQYKIRRNR